MLGMQKTGRRLHIVPPTLGYGSKGIPNRVPSSSTLVYNVEIRRVGAHTHTHIQFQTSNSILL